MFKMLCGIVAILGMHSCAWAVTKCTGDGKTWYQDTPCPAGATSTQLELEANPPTPPQPNSSPARRSAPTSSAAAPAATASAPVEETSASALEREAQMCFGWYQANFPMGEGATYTIRGKNQRVLTIVISVPFTSVNTAGVQTTGTQATPASCDIHNGVLDDGWTRTHAGRGPWPR